MKFYTKRNGGHEDPSSLSKHDQAALILKGSILKEKLEIIQGLDSHILQLSKEEDIVREIEETDLFRSRVTMIIAKQDSVLSTISPNVVTSDTSKEPTSEPAETDLRGLRRLYDSVVDSESYGSLLLSVFIMSKIPQGLIISREFKGGDWGLDMLLHTMERELEARERTVQSNTKPTALSSTLSPKEDDYHWTGLPSAAAFLSS